MLSNTNTLAATATSRSQETPCSDKNFPSRLFRFLNLVESYDLSHIASWQPHGRCFRIHNPKEFVNLTEPSWFVYSKYSSFQRQLNIYGFTRITSGSDKNCYFHEHFLRGQEHLLHKIIRIPTKKDAPYLSRVLNQAPDFEIMPAVNETDSSTSEAHPRLSIAMLNSRIQHINSSADYVQADSDVERRIEFLQSTNDQYANDTIQQGSTTRRYRDSLLNSNPPVTSASNDAILLLQMLQNRTSVSAASELSLALSQLQAPVEASLSLRTVLLELLRQQLNLASTTALPLGLSHSSQIRTSQFDSLSAARSRLSSLIQQHNLQNQARGLAFDPLRQMQYSDPLLLNQIQSVAARSLQNQLLEHQLNRHDDVRRLNAISFLPNATGSDLLRAVTHSSERRTSDNLDFTNPQQTYQRSTTDDTDTSSNIP